MKLMIFFDHDGVQDAGIANAILAFDIPANAGCSRVEDDDDWTLLSVEDEMVARFFEIFKQPDATEKIQQNAILHDPMERIGCNWRAMYCSQRVFGLQK
ncbi:MAG: hypothetical protein LBH02_01620 [Methanocalculaceae archaeon]|jgi:hypothetical protein|nr:hypothetical protein [Methanocalculaceae archaeon]